MAFIGSLTLISSEARAPAKNTLPVKLELRNVDAAYGPIQAKAVNLFGLYSHFIIAIRHLLEF